MSDSYLFLQPDLKISSDEILIKSLENYSNERKESIYVIDRPLGDNKYFYEYDDKIIILNPGYKILIVNLSENDSDDFDLFCEDFIEDLGYLSDKFKYKEVIGRPRAWKRNLINRVNQTDISSNPQEFFQQHKINNLQDKKFGELIISLLTGSINDIDRVKKEVPTNILDTIKQKIILFDCEQTRFIYKKPDKKKILIQGLSGTGKTELLLHKLRELYVNHENSKIIFTCHSKTLANSLKQRIPDFFTFMKVEEQIIWDDRLLCVHAYGSRGVKNSGIYSYICQHYGLTFYPYSPRRGEKNYEFICANALEELSKLDVSDDKKYAFDFVLIDESQDFPPVFFELLEKVTKNNVYIAGDIFQSIFSEIIISEIEADYRLSKCYRTDPKTLMFAHALGLGLFERPPLRWLDDQEWNACGYAIKKPEEAVYELTREPLKRFEEIEEQDIKSVELIRTPDNNPESMLNEVIKIITKIREDNPTVLPEDIGIIDLSANNFRNADVLTKLIYANFDWITNLAYNSKEFVKGQVFISNRNNFKGLEFPFAICIIDKINKNINYRNSLYTMLTRSFIKSYFVIEDRIDNQLINKIEAGLNIIQNDNCLRINEPSDFEKKEMEDRIIRYRQKKEKQYYSDYDRIYKMFNDLSIPLKPSSVRKDLYKTLITLTNSELPDDDDELQVKIRKLYEVME